MKEYEVESGKTFIGKINKVGNHGDGIVFLHKMVVFIPGVKIGQKCKFEIIRVNDRFANARLIEILGEEGKK